MCIYFFLTFEYSVYMYFDTLLSFFREREKRGEKRERERETEREKEKMSERECVYV